MVFSKSLRVLQVNLNRSLEATESALQVAIEQNIDLIIIQEPWLVHPNLDNYSNTRSIQHSSFSQLLPQLLPTNQNLRPRTLAYISRSLQYTVSLALESPLDPDCLVLDILEGTQKIQIVNIYNEKDQSGLGPKTVDRTLYPSTLYYNSIVLGDFNTHHPWWDPLAYTCSGADKLVEWFEANDLTLLNTPGTGTFFRPNLQRETVLDLTLVTSSLADRTEDWQVLPDLGSDHYGIAFTITGTGLETTENPLAQQVRFDTSKANWDLFSSRIQSAQLDHITTLSAKASPETLELAAQDLTQAITQAATSSIPTSKPGARPKPWWNPELKELRKSMLQHQRNLQKSLRLSQSQGLQPSNSPSLFPTARHPYLVAKNTYFQAIKQAKRDHWNQFLEKEDPQSIFKAMAYTKPSRIEKIPTILGATLFPDKCQVLRNSLFPAPPEAPEPSWEGYSALDWNWPALLQSELEATCTAKTKGKTPGPDGITHEIIQHAYMAIPLVFFGLYSRLLDIGYHPRCWKQATGAILKKPSKPDYSAPKAYRVISLLNCLGKISERILAQRLSHLAETTTLLHPSQIGGRLHKSAIDTALILTNEVESTYLKTTALFLDIKGAFDHVAKNRLLAILKKLGLPFNLISWVSSFLSNRTLRLAFDGQIEGFSNIDTGIPQGSPISPILFLIYIRDLFPSLASSVKPLSYIDDIALVVSTTSLKKNITILEREVAKLYDLAAQNAIEFDLAKTELIHFAKGKATNLPSASLQLPNQEVIHPKELVRWLGIWFDPGLVFKQHIAIQTSQARSSFNRMCRIANSERGLTPFALRQLYLACIASIADYGSPIWWRGQAQLLRPLQALQNLALRKILGVFRTAPIRPMEVEAVLVPPSIRLDTSLRKYALRALKLAPTHPINQARPRPRLSEPTSSPVTSPIQAKRKPKPNQLDRIWTTIKGLVDFETLEPIRHFRYSTSEKTPLYSVSISQLSKEEATIAHLASLKLEANHFAIYTDASSLPEATGIGIGLALFGNNSPITRPLYTQSYNLGPEQLVYNGELEGVTQAAELASRIAKPGQVFRIYTDNQAGLLRLKSPSDKPGQACQIRTSLATEQARAIGASIELYWVPGHTDIPGNELADKLAKTAALALPDSETTSYAYLGTQIRELQTLAWLDLLNSQKASTNLSSYSQLFPWKLHSKIRLPTGTKREIASAFFRLKLGHGYLKNYLFRLGHTENNRCQCGIVESTAYLLLKCPMLNEARAGLKTALKCTSLSLGLLLDTKIGIEATISFLKTTQIATRKWHLARSRTAEELSELSEQSGGRSEDRSEGRREEGRESPDELVA